MPQRPAAESSISHDGDSEELPEPGNQTKTLEARARGLSESPRDCAGAVGYKGIVERCVAQVVGSGAAILVQVITDCGGDSCSVSAFLLRSDGRAQPLPEIDGGTSAFAPDLSRYLTDTRRFSSQEDQAENFYTRAPELLQIELATSKTTPFAACMSPVLSPEGNWVLCRNRWGDVLRVPLSGGQPELVTTNPAERAIAWSPYAFVYPGPVQFMGSDEFTFEVGDVAGHAATVPWSPQKLPPRPRITEAAETLSYNERPLFCGEATPAALGLREACREGGLPVPAISADGRRLAVVESWSSCCAESSWAKADWFALGGPQGPHITETSLLYEANADGEPMLSGRQTAARVSKLLSGMRAAHLEALAPIPIPSEALYGGAHAFTLSQSELLVLAATGPRLLRHGQVVWHEELELVSSHPFCCDLGAAQDANPGDGEGCERPVYPLRGWYAARQRVLVVEFKNVSGPDACEIGPVTKVFQLPPLS